MDTNGDEVQGLMATLLEFEQSDLVRDHVFPLITLKGVNGGSQPRLGGYLGTGFLIGSRGFGLTAAHVLEGHELSGLAALFAVGDEWRYFRLGAHCAHPVEDVAAFRLGGKERWRSLFDFAPQDVRQSLEYSMWGYPTDAFLAGQAAGPPIPDMVYARGYVRRRISGYQLPSIRGRNFLEVSEIVGAGCSGGPLHLISGREGRWPVVGIYLGSRNSTDGAGGDPVSHAYAVSADAFRDWTPECMDESVESEARKGERSL